MSYSIRIIKDADGLRLADVPEAARHHVPDGVIVVNGHHVPAGEQGTESLAVSVQPADGGPELSASSWVTVARRKVAAAEPATT